MGEGKKHRHMMFQIAKSSQLLKYVIEKETGCQCKVYLKIA